MALASAHFPEFEIQFQKTIKGGLGEKLAPLSRRGDRLEKRLMTGVSAREFATPR
jgi:hypothetical protein